MKTLNKSGFNFGFSVVNAGQRVNEAEPQLVVNSTEGGFRVTGPVTKALGIENGEYVMFINNVDAIDQAISAKAEPIKKFCEENGLDIDSVEAKIALHKEFDMWAIAKGVEEYDLKGNMKTSKERLSKKDKMTFVNQHFEEMLTQAMESEDEEVKASLSREGITSEEQAEILIGFVIPKDVIKFKGSKASNTSGYSGIGNTLNFTDSNVWKQIKADLDDETAKSVNRVFDIDLDEMQKVEIFNGYETVVVNALVLGDYTDKEPVRRGGKDEDAEDAE